MTTSSENKNLSMISIPIQSWAEVYTFDSALKCGTIFPDLNKPFYAAEPPQGSILAENSIFSSKADDNKEKKSMLFQITCISFVLDDLTLYLDTHPDCVKGLNLYKECHQRREALIKDFSSNYYPLNRDSIDESEAAKAPFNWNIGPMPWEGGLL